MAEKIEISTVEDAVLKEMTAAVRIILIRKGIERNSNLVKSAEVKWDDKRNAFVLLANDYFEYASGGRRPNARKVPIADLLDWMKRYGIRPRAGQTVNQTAFSIQTAIYKSGIKKKNYADPVEDTLTELSSEATAELLSEVIAEAIAETIDNT